jgi:ABC-type transport system involved in multi-copper enzyme maturation permease subunit
MNGRMISAEVLRLRKSRALMIWLVVLTTGAVTAFFLIAQGFHLNDSANNGPAGGAVNFRHALMLLSILGSVAATILGTNVGTSDVTAGVFRDLVVTGVSRLRLYLARVPGLLAVWLPIILLGYVVATVFNFAFAGNLRTLNSTQILKDGLWVVVVTSIALMVAMGLSALIGSRGITIGILLGWQLAISPLLGAISVLGVTREALLEAATSRIQPFTGGDRGTITMSLLAAIVVLLCWIAVPLAIGAWRTTTRDA